MVMIVSFSSCKIKQLKIVHHDVKVYAWYIDGYIHDYD